MFRRSSRVWDPCGNGARLAKLICWWKVKQGVVKLVVDGSLRDVYLRYMLNVHVRLLIVCSVELIFLVRNLQYFWFCIPCIQSSLPSGLCNLPLRSSRNISNASKLIFLGLAAFSEVYRSLLCGGCSVSKLCRQRATVMKFEVKAPTLHNNKKKPKKLDAMRIERTSLSCIHSRTSRWGLRVSKGSGSSHWESHQAIDWTRVMDT